MKYNKLVIPVVKWAGGKRQLLPEISKYIPDNIETYYEPFLGGGAVLFHLQPERAVVNDINEELIILYTVIRSNIDELIADLKTHINEPEYFYNIRELDRDGKKYSTLTDVQRASRIHYLNKTCFNGLFRVNRAGHFNAPYGKYKKPNIVNEVTFRAVSKYLNEAKVEFRCGDFEKSLDGIKGGDFVYFDPPYDPISDSSNFTGYAKGGFDIHEQERLKKVCDELNSRGVRFLVSNSATEYIKDLYSNYHIEIVQAKRAINSKPDERGEVDEVLVRNYE